MELSKAAKIWIDYHKTNSKKKTRCGLTEQSSKVETLSGSSVMAPLIRSPRNTSLTFLNRLTYSNKPYQLIVTLSFHLSSISSVITLIPN